MSKSTHILIVDDEANLRQTMARILKREGYEVTAVATGKEGFSMIAEHVFDLVYLDIRMPDMSGLDMLKSLHVSHPELPIILFTAQPDVHSAVQALRLGASDYLLKPLKPTQVIEHTKAILTKQEQQQRKKEIQNQIQSLELELKTLEGGNPPPDKTDTSPSNGDRFMKRGKLILDLHRYQVKVGARISDLPLTAFNYLLVLARHAPGVVNYQTLVAEAQGYEADSREAQELAKWHIHHIRQAIEVDARRPNYIINVRGAGYRLVID